MSKLIYKDESYAIMGACFEVYNDKGCGFLESVYQECLKIEFELLGLPVIPKAELKLSYKGRVLEKTYEPDFLCFDKIILETRNQSRFRVE